MSVSLCNKMYGGQTSPVDFELSARMDFALLCLLPLLPVRNSPTYTQCENLQYQCLIRMFGPRGNMQKFRKIR